MKRLLGIVLVTSSLLAGVGWLTAADDAQEEAIKKDRKAMQGRWTVASYELDGNRPLSDEQLQSVRAMFDATGKTLGVQGFVRETKASTHGFA